MINKNNRLLSLLFAVFFYNVLLITSCKNDKPDVSSIPVIVRAQRFERDLFGMNTFRPDQGVAGLRNKYGNFFDLFAFQVTTLGSRDSVLLQDHFLNFVLDTNFRAIYTECEKQFGDFSKQDAELSKAFQYYKYYFPSKNIPAIVTLVSAFSYPIVCDSTTLGISLDMYLGSSNRFYSTLEPPLPNYLRAKMRPEYMVSDAMKGWAMSDYGIDEASAKMVDMMVSEGRILYFLDKVLPDANDSIKIGYSATQLKWCKENEKKVWSFFIDNQLVFSADPNVLAKFAGEGPTTNGFPKESPGNIAQYIGWQIVRSYMKGNKETTLEQLMNEKDMQKIFKLSNYKPAK